MKHKLANMKTQTLFVAGVAVALGLSACGLGDSAVSGGSSGDGDSLTIAGTLPANTAMIEGAERISDSLDESDVDLAGDVYSDGQLGGEPEMMDALETGTVDIAMVGVPLVAQHCSALGMNALPYVIQGDNPEEQYENLQKVTDSELHQQAVEECAEETGYRVIDASWWYGNRELTSNKEIHSVADMKGLKVRTPEGSLHSKPFEVLGADPVPMAQDEVYTALETGVIDAQENPFATIAKFSFEDVQDYLVLTSLMTHNQALVMWDDTYQDLTDEQRDALLSAVDEAGQWQSEEQLKENAELRDQLEENGIEIIEPDLDEFTEATRDFVEEYFEDNDLDFEEYLAIQE